ncbi:MAG: alpha/beta hydrolase [Planctomycetaceae bacterium]|nr:alpha/beta hydrolase [Planctomycetaceae bacterium]
MRDSFRSDRNLRLLMLLVGVSFGLMRPAVAQPPTTEPLTPAQIFQPTFADVSYGPHARHLMDVWLAESDTPTPVLISIHGGAFRHGDKSVSRAILRECLNSGISVVAITYRFTDEVIAPAQHRDVARAVQFVRHKAKEWNIDPTRIAATGGSAGAGMSLWLGFHDDMADPDSDDPVLRESTRLTCMAVNNGQSSYDPRFIRDLFPDTDIFENSALAQLFDVDLDKLDDLPEEMYRLFEEVSAMTHLSKEDAPVLMTYDSEFDTPVSSRSIGIHHPRFGQVLKSQMDKLGIECRVETGMTKGDGRRPDLVMAFLKRHLARPPIVTENVTYSTVDGVDLQLDLARPAGEGAFPAIVFIHGGGWYAGDRHGYRDEIEQAARRGYVGVTVSYRLMQFDESMKETTTATDIFPAQVYDVKAAVRWLRAHAAEHHIDPNRIGATGQSAGGHLSLMLGLTDAQFEGNGDNKEFSSRVQAVVNVFGPTDMAECFRMSSVGWIFRLVTGGTPGEVPEAYRLASPLTYVSKDDPPVLTLHGEQDRLVPIEQARMLDQRMKEADASHTLMVFEGQGHGFVGEHRQKERDAMWEFFERHLKP